MKIEKNRQVLFFVSLIGIIIVTLIMGTTFAYQTLIVDYKDGSDNDIVVDAGKLNVSYEKTNKIDLKNMTLLPDYKTADYTEFTIKTNDTSYDVAYQINLKKIEYTGNINNENFKYTLTKIDSNEEIVLVEGNFSSLNGTEMNLPFNINTYRILEKGKNETLRLYLWLKESDNIQNIENSSFKANIEVVSLFANEISDTFYKTFKILGRSSQLPQDYQEVEYIESSGTQYIDTAVIPNNNTGFKIKLSLPELTKDTFRFGCRQDTGDTRFILGSQNGGVYFGFGKVIAKTWDNVQVDIPFEANLNYLNSRVANVNNLDDINISDISIEFTYSLIMFGRKSIDNISSSSQKIYSCKITNENNIIRDFIPCYRKSDNVIGMYDVVNNQFYTNNGTGNFEKGIDLYSYLGEFDETTNKYKVTITIKINDVVHSSYDIYIDEPLRKLNDTYDYIDIINRRVVRNIKVEDNNLIELEEPIYENLENVYIPYIENSEISICNSQNICTTDNIEIETNK